MVAVPPPVPGAVVVEDNGSAVSYSPAENWTLYNDDELYTGHSYHLTYVGDAMVEFTFTGSYVWFGADRNTDHGIFIVQLDDETESQYSGASTALEKQQILLERTVVPGQHVLRIKNGEDKKALGVDYFAYLPLNVSSYVPVASSTTVIESSESSSSSNPPASSTPLVPDVSSASGGLATPTKIGIALGVLGIALFAILGLLLWRDRREDRQRRIKRQTQAQPWIQEPSARYGAYTPPGDARYNTITPYGLPMSALPNEGYRESLFSVDPPDTEADVLPSGVARRYFARSDHTPSVPPTQFGS